MLSGFDITCISLLRKEFKNLNKFYGQWSFGSIFFNQENCDFQSPEPLEDCFDTPDHELFVSNTLTWSYYPIQAYVLSYPNKLDLKQ